MHLGLLLTISLQISINLVTKQIYNFGIVKYNLWCTYSPLVPKRDTFMLQMVQPLFCNSRSGVSSRKLDRKITHPLSHNSSKERNKYLLPTDTRPGIGITYTKKSSKYILTIFLVKCSFNDCITVLKRIFRLVVLSFLLQLRLT